MAQQLMRLMPLFLLVAFLAACGGGSRYRVEPMPASETVPARVVVTNFTDNRTVDGRQVSLSRSAPFAFYNSWRYSRPDDVYSTYVESFPSLMAKSLAEALEESNLFESVAYAAPDRLPESGTYDLLITGDLNNTTARGNVYLYSLGLPLGFQFSDIAWYLGMPKFTRRYELDVALRVLNGYTGEQIGQPITFQETTGSKTFLVYANESRLDDFQRRIISVWNDYLEAEQSRSPAPSDEYWANLRADGQRFLAQAAFEEERIRRGAPPVFTFLSPANNTELRNATAQLQWSITAQNGLRSVALTLNDQIVETGLRTIDMADPMTAPRAVPAQQLPINLRMGRNVLEARVTDHQNNTTPAELVINRLPQQLTPANRHALVIGVGSNEATATADEIARILRDPLLGQFRDGDINTVTSSAVTAADIDRAISQFTARPRSGDLAFVYVSAPASVANASIGRAGEVPLSGLIDSLQRGLATEEVIVVLDLDWDTTDENRDVANMFSESNRQWAVALSSLTPMPAPKANGKTLFGDLFASILRNGRGGTNLSIELLLDSVFAEAESRTNGQMIGDVEGRYNPSIIMIQYE